MQKREAVDHILIWKSRKGRIAHLDLIHKVDELASLWMAKGADLDQLSDFFVMRLVTLIEVFFRDMVREIVDKGTPYVERSEKLTKGTKLDFLFALNLHTRAISIGDIVAHSLPANRIEQVVSALCDLIPEYRNKLILVHDRWAEEIDGAKPSPVITDIDEMFADLTELFEVRHIITHETPALPPYSLERLPVFLQASKKFMNATGWLVTEELNGIVPLTQLDMNINAGELMEKELAAMNQVLQDVRNSSEVDFTLLEESQLNWNVFAETEARLHAAQVKGGSMYSMIYASTKTELVSERIVQLRRWLNVEEGIH